MASTNLAVTELDFKRIKSSLRQFLTEQDQFKDYNFEGSYLSVILDILSYNTHYNAIYNHMAIAESFLDSASRRSSLISRAKELGYTPRSMSAASAVITAIISGVTATEAQTFKTMQRGTIFRGVLGNKQFDFVVVEPAKAYLRNNAYVFDNVTVKEGVLKSFSFNVTEDNYLKPFTLPHPNIDTTTIRVMVQNSITDTTVEQYFYAPDTYDVDNDSKVFWAQIGIFNQPEIYFGDYIPAMDNKQSIGALGLAVRPGNIIQVDYLVTPDYPNNGVSNFVAITSVAGFDISRVQTITIDSAYGGSQPETEDSIRRNAPLYHAARGRAVTVNDYYAHIQNKYPFIETISIWGGEDNIPPEYGRVFISIKPKSGYYISEITKEQIAKQLLESKNVVTIQPRFVDPKYLYLSLNVEILLDSQKSTVSSLIDFNNSVNLAISQYFSTRLNQFNNSYIGAELIHYIRSLDRAITGVDVVPTLILRIPFRAGIREQHLMTFGNKIRYASVMSQPFSASVGNITTDMIIKDVPIGLGDSTAYSDLGTLYLYSYIDNKQISNIGTVDYNSGEIVINELTANLLYNYTGSDIMLTAELRGYDAFAKHNTIITQDPTPTGSVPAINTGVFVTSAEV